MPGQSGQKRGNSGVYLNGRYEIQILDSHRARIDPKVACGALYGQIGPIVEATRPAETWQTLDLAFRAPRPGPAGAVARKGELTVILNGVKVIDRAEFDTPSAGGLGVDLVERGPIILQDHGNAVRFRGLRLRELAASADAAALAGGASSPPNDFVSLFNGRDLSGWTAYGGPKWSWADSRLLASPGGTGFLFTDAEYDDFELELQFRLGVGAGSGLFLRADPSGPVSGAKQLEVQIIDDAYPQYASQGPMNLTGTVFGVFPRRTTPPIKRGDWNTLRVRLDKRRIEVWVNGTQTLDANLDDARDKFAGNPGLARASGRIGLQPNQRTDVEFRDVKVRRLSS
jgi:hypothetical protein